MKRLIILIIILFASCSIDVEKVDKPEEFTTVEILNQPRENVELTMLDDKVYIIQDGLVQYELINYNDNYILIHESTIITILIVMWLIGYILLIRFSTCKKI